MTGVFDGAIEAESLYSKVPCSYRLIEDADFSFVFCIFVVASARFAAENYILAKNCSNGDGFFFSTFLPLKNELDV